MSITLHNSSIPQWGQQVDGDVGHGDVCVWCVAYRDVQCGALQGAVRGCSGKGVMCVVWCSAWCGMVWCGVVWCGAVWCVWCGVVWCGVVWCGVVWCGIYHGFEARAGEEDFHLAVLQTVRKDRPH